MNYKVVLQLIGYMLIGLGVLIFIPLLAAFYYGEKDSSAFLISGGACILCGFLLAMLFRNNDTIAEREGFTIVTLSWVFFSIFGCLPYMLSTPAHSFTDSFFETMSGFTTTGSTIFTDIEAHTKSILLWRSITQWLGGMGIIVLGLAILPILGVGGMQLFRAETPGPVSTKLTPRIKDTAKILWLVYVGLTAIQFLLLCLAGMPVFDSICHSLTTMPTGGFSPKAASIGHYESSAIHWIITIFMLLAGINFSIHFQILRGIIRKTFADSELRTYLFLALCFTLLICINLFTKNDITGYSSFSICLRDASFTVASILTTTGYATADFELWPVFSQGLIFVLLFLGSCAGSTGGGIKTIRLIVLYRFACQQLYYLLHPRAILNLKVDEKVVKNNIIFGVLGFFIIYIGFFTLGAIALMGTGQDFLTALSASAACIGNVGPGLGAVGPMDNFAHITTFGKWCLIFLMLLGRLELFTVLVIFSAAFWKD
jgi:trk system potassium uptake protein TrkH